jgi:hypothetical protein
MIGEKEITGSFGCLKKGKKGNIGKSPRQPQRGLGVAQLEKIRLQRQIAEYIDPSMQSPFLGNIQKVCYYGFYDFCSFFREKKLAPLSNYFDQKMVKPQKFSPLP